MRDQAYYWTPEWQADEQESVTALERGEGLRFGTAREAIDWLMADPDPATDAGGPPAAPGAGGPDA